MFDGDVDGAKSSRSETGGPPTAATMSWVERTVKQAIEADREQERQLWREVFGEVLAAEQRKIDDFGRRLDGIERSSSLEVQFRELELRLDARQLARDEAKRGPRGDRGLAGERGPRGERGAKGEPGREAAKIAGWEMDIENYRAYPVMSDGTRGPALDFRPLLQRFLDDTR
jgi:hypothetical protein